MAPRNIKPFAVENVRKKKPYKLCSHAWMDEYETTAKFNIAETCVASISLEQLKELSEDKSSEIWDPSTVLTYGPIRGSEKLRCTLANLYSSKASSPFQSEHVLITPGAIAANYNVFYGLIGEGDHVICHYPTYQQLYDVPASLGAEVSLWRAQEDNKWQLDGEELKSLVRPNTKMIVINNPHNPTGAIISKKILEQILEVAREHDLMVLSDEVYRPIFHSIGPMDPDFPPSLLSLAYPKAIVTGSLSKAYALAGIRVGWIASRSSEIIEACAQARHYTTISVNQLSDQIAAFALGPSCIHGLLSRNIGLAKTNLALVDSFVESHRWACEWTKPVAGTTAFIKFSKMGREVDDVAFCKQLLEKTGVMFCPGSLCFGDEKDFKGYVRMGFVCETDVLREGLAAVKGFMRNGFEGVALAEWT